MSKLKPCSTMGWITKLPDKEEVGNACIVTTLCANGQRIVQNGWYGWGEVMAKTIAYMQYPTLDPKNKGKWKSEYWEDDLPTESGHYIVAVEKPYGILILTSFAWFNSTKNNFSGGMDVFAWHQIPKPYSGQGNYL